MSKVYRTLNATALAIFAVVWVLDIADKGFGLVHLLAPCAAYSLFRLTEPQRWN